MYHIMQTNCKYGFNLISYIKKNMTLWKVKVKIFKHSTQIYQVTQSNMGDCNYFAFSPLRTVYPSLWLPC